MTDIIGSYHFYPQTFSHVPGLIIQDYRLGVANGTK